MEACQLQKPILFLRVSVKHVPSCHGVPGTVNEVFRILFMDFLYCNLTFFDVLLQAKLACKSHFEWLTLPN